MNCSALRALNCITPPHVLKKLLESGDRHVREAAMRTLIATAELRGERKVRSVAGFGVSHGDGRRTIFDCRHSNDLSSAVIARTEDGDSDDASVNAAFDGLGYTRDFYKDEFQRNSIDGQGMRLDGYVHRGDHFNNAFWDGQEMVFGDGDGVVFTDFTGSVDVIGHELTHGVTEFSAGLEYSKQPGALNESISDVFGSLVKQWSKEPKQTAEEADWLIGTDIFTPTIGGDALRSMKAPGTAYDNEWLGKDPQPDHMDNYYPGSDDNFGVHINSGIPNKAFYLVAVGIGGYAWETAGHIWYESLLASHSLTQFQEFADTTYFKAGNHSSEAQRIVADAWRQVGIRISGTVVRGLSRQAADGRQRIAEICGTDNGNGDTLAAFQRTLVDLSARLEKHLKRATAKK